ncbi:MAG: hypothetical protein LUG99_12010 [Lachnospiraceae bacterium]|nr:hypothetical protein [Lachnospiraceae bacterium]
MNKTKTDTSSERNETIIVRCSEEEKQKIEKNSARRNLPIDVYLLERGLASAGRRCPKSRERAETMVYLQQIINDLEQDEEQRRLSKKDAIKRIQEGVDRLWDV